MALYELRIRYLSVAYANCYRTTEFNYAVLSSPFNFPCIAVPPQ